MKHIESPDDAELRNVGKKHDWAVGAPAETLDLTEDDIDRLDRSISRLKDGEGERAAVVKMLEPGGKGDDEIRNFRIDFEALLTVLYEHRRYALAQGFSDAEMDVLRAIEFHNEDRVTIDELMEDFHAQEYSQATIYKCLRTLQEKELIEKEKPGLYRYRGP